MKIRCSSLPMLRQCSQSLCGETAIGGERAAATLGTACHAAMRQYLERGVVDIGGIADAHNVDVLALRKPFRQMAWTWREKLADHFPDPMIEHSMEYEADGVLLTGTADVVSVVDGEVRVCDFKSGYKESDHWDQLIGYAFLASHEIGDKWMADKAYAVVLHARSSTVDGRYFDAGTLSDWWNHLVTMAKDKTYRPGSHCQYCPRAAHDCDHRTALLREGALALAVRDAGQTDWTDLSAEELLDLHGKTKVIADLCDRIRRQVQVEVEARGNNQALADGRYLCSVEKSKRAIDVAAAMPLLRQALGDDKLARILKVSNGDVEEVLKSLTAHGMKGKRVAELWDGLEEAGAVVRSKWRQVEVRHKALENHADHPE